MRDPIVRTRSCWESRLRAPLLRAIYVRRTLRVQFFMISASAPLNGRGADGFPKLGEVRAWCIR
jgi:hypothetical protein